MKKKVLFVCERNSARSQMAEAWLKHLAGDRFVVHSAGLEPGTLNPHAIAVMAEAGIDIAGNQTDSVFAFYKQGRLYDYVITVCSPEKANRCPVFPGITTRLHWDFPDPAGFTGTEEEILARTRNVRDTIRAKVAAFISNNRQ